MRKRWMAYIFVFAIFAGLLLFTGCGRKAAENKEGYVTRGQWIVMLAEKFGMDAYEADMPYYVDIDGGSELFASVQSAAEWNVLSVYQTKKLEPDRPVTVEEAACSAAIAAGFSVREDQFDKQGNYDSADAIDYATSQGIIKVDKDLSAFMTEEECEAVLAAAQYSYLNKPVEEKINVVPNEALVDFSVIPADSIETDKNTVMLAGNVVDAIEPDGRGGMKAVVRAGNEKLEIEAGSVFITAPTAEYPSGIAYKVLSIAEADGEIIVMTEPPALEDLYDELVVHTTVSTTPNNIIWAEGVSVSPAFVGGISLNSDNGYYAGTLSCHDAASGLVGLSHSTDNFDLSYDFEFGSGDYEKTWNGRNSTVIGNGAGAQALEISNFVFYDTPGIEDFKGLPDSWTRKLESENKFSAGYQITGNITIHALTVTTDVEYYKVDAFLWEIETSIPQSAALQISSDISVTLKLEGNLNGRLKIATVQIPIAATGLTVTVDLYLYVDASGVLQVEAMLGSSAKVEWEALTKLRHSVAAEAQSEIQMAVDIDFGADLAASLNAFGTVKIIDAGVKAGGSLTAEAGIRGSCGTVTEEGVTTQTYTEAMYIESKLYVPVVSLYLGSEDSLLAKAGISGSWDIIGKENGAKCLPLIEEEWVIWTLQNIFDENGEIVESSNVTAEPDESNLLEAMQNGDFSCFAGTYTPYLQSPYLIEQWYTTDLILNEDGTIIGSYGRRSRYLEETFWYPFEEDTFPFSVTQNENGAFICELSNWSLDNGYREQILYIICPIGISGDLEYYGSYDDLTGTNEVRIRYMEIRRDSLVDLMFYKTE